jgi:hypothetical protein
MVGLVVLALINIIMIAGLYFQLKNYIDQQLKISSKLWDTYYSSIIKELEKNNKLINKIPKELIIKNVLKLP